MNNIIKETKTEKTSIESIIADLLQKYSDLGENASVDDFLKEQMTASGHFSEEEISSILTEISETLEQNSETLKQIHEYKKEGISVKSWLRDTIDRATQLFSLDKVNDIAVGNLEEVIELNTSLRTFKEKEQDNNK
ncbi:MAG: hypothetical protein LBT50_00550 [Prevotellaceae bacterium]|jgi:lipopolysaccharide biosynthesis regulator YciM|nr:hypothetical protein [Prevotellaceae bacterium]